MQMKIKYWAALILMAAAAGPASAQNGYNANVRGRIDQLITYVEDGMVLFTISPMPATPQCGAPYFRIAPTLPLDMRQQVFSRLMAAYTSREEVHIGYDGQTCAPDGYIKVYRVG
jgi:hypothetical protein